jgi:hypothetical protein
VLAQYAMGGVVNGFMVATGLLDKPLEGLGLKSYRSGQISMFAKRYPLQS